MARRLTHEEFIAKIRKVGLRVVVLSIYRNCRSKVDARCEVCGYQWTVFARNLLKGHSCPECGKKKAREVVKHPRAAQKFAAEVPKLHNGTVELLSPYIGLEKPINVRCNVCGYEWETIPCRLRKSGCWRCGHKSKGLKQRKPPEEFAEQVERIHDGSIQLLGIYQAGKNRIDVECRSCGHKWFPVAQRLLRRGCPECCQSKGERRIAHFLKAKGVRFVREYTFLDLISPNRAKLRFDFAVFSSEDTLTHLIEFDGYQHTMPVEHFGGLKRLERQQRNDALKDEYCRRQGIPLTRIRNILPSDITPLMLMAQTLLKQVLVIRTKYPDGRGGHFTPTKGKLVCQGAHAAMAFILDELADLREKLVKGWFDQGQTKICLRVDSERDFWEIRKKAQQAGLRVHAIQDAGKTEFKKPTWTCLAIGPNKAEDIDKITGHLKLL